MKMLLSKGWCEPLGIVPGFWFEPATRNQKPETYLGELFEEPDVVFEEQSNVVDVIHQSGHPIYAKSESETRELFGIDANLLEHIRVNHPASTELDPARALANAAPVPAAHVATEIHFGGGLGEREIRWPKARPQVRS